MSELITIKANARTEIGKNYCRQLRVQGKIPGNIMNKTQATMIELDPKFLSVAWKSGKKFNLDFNGDVRAVFIKELQINPVKRTALHVDLMYL
jgi:large subunit ribosomal protein L25